MSDGLYLFTPSSPPPPPPSSSVDTYSKTKTKKADTRERPASTKRDRSGTFIRRSPICVDLTFITEAEMEEEQRQRRQQQQQRRIPSNAKKSKTSPLVNNNNNNNNTTILTGGNGVSSYMCDSNLYWDGDMGDIAQALSECDHRHPSHENFIPSVKITMTKELGYDSKDPPPKKTPTRLTRPPKKLPSSTTTTTRNASTSRSKTGAVRRAVTDTRRDVILISDDPCTDAPSSAPKCPICLDTIYPPSTVATTHCNHQYCKECLEEWLRAGPHCPVCRFDLRSVRRPYHFPPHPLG